jgi:hypothetical protein
MNVLKLVLKSIGYGFGALFVLAGLAGHCAHVPPPRTWRGPAP